MYKRQIQDIVADEDWYDEHAEIGVTEARKIRSSYEVGDRIITPLKTLSLIHI